MIANVVALFLTGFVPLVGRSFSSGSRTSPSMGSKARALASVFPEVLALTDFPGFGTGGKGPGKNDPVGTEIRAPVRGRRYCFHPQKAYRTARTCEA
jgi:hypothetical protein